MIKLGSYTQGLHCQLSCIVYVSMPAEVIIACCVILLGCATVYKVMSLPAPNYGLNTPCASCRDRKAPDGVWRWSSVARHYPFQNAEAKLRLLTWLRDMLSAPGVCNECARVLNMVAVELAIMATDQQ